MPTDHIMLACMDTCAFMPSALQVEMILAKTDARITGLYEVRGGGGGGGGLVLWCGRGLTVGMCGMGVRGRLGGPVDVKPRLAGWTK